MNFLKKLFGSNAAENTAPAAEEELTPQEPVAEPLEETDEDPEEELEDEDDEHDRKYKFETLRDDGLRAMQISQVEYAIKCFTTALEYQDDPNTRLRLVEAYLLARQGEPTLPLLAQLLETDKDNPLLYVYAADAAEMLKQWDMMEGNARKAMELQPDDDTPLYLLARCLYNQEKYLEAEESFTTLLWHDESYVTVRSLRAKARFEQEKYAEAEEDLDYLIAKGTATEDTYLLKGEIHEKLADEAGAIEAYQKMISENPFNMDAPVKLADIAIRNNDLPKALTIMDDAISMQENFPIGYAKRAEIKRAMGDEAGAAADEERAVIPEPETQQEEGTLENKMEDYYKSLNPYGF